MISNTPSVIRTLASQCPADSSPYTGEPTAAAGLLNGKSLYGTTRLAGGFREPKRSGTYELIKFICTAFSHILIYRNKQREQLHPRW